MKDRIPLNPGRVKLTLVSGNIYDMEMADDPIEAGTPLNKSNLLTDATAAEILALTGSTPATPNEALSLIATKGTRIEHQSYIGTGTYGSSNKKTITFSFVPKLVILGCTDLNPTTQGVAYKGNVTAIFSWDSAIEIYDAWVAAGSSSSFPPVITQFAQPNNPQSIFFALSNDYKSITFYSQSNASAQYNTLDTPYHVIAIG